MSSRSIISISLSCKCSFDHSLHFVSIYQSQDSVNLKQQHSKSKETQSPKAFTASWGGDVWVCLFSKLFKSKNFPNCCRIQLRKARGNFHSLKTDTARVRGKAPAGCWKLIAAPADREQAQDRGVLRWQNLFKVSVRLLGPIHSSLKSLKPIGRTYKVLRSRSFAGLNPLYALAAAYIAFRTQQKHCLLIPSPGTERRTGLQMLSLAMRSKKFFSTI